MMFDALQGLIMQLSWCRPHKSARIVQIQLLYEFEVHSPSKIPWFCHLSQVPCISASVLVRHSLLLVPSSALATKTHTASTGNDQTLLNKKRNNWQESWSWQRNVPQPQLCSCRLKGLQHYQQLPSTNCAINLWATLGLIAINLRHSRSAALCYAYIFHKLLRDPLSKEN